MSAARVALAAALAAALLSGCTSDDGEEPQTPGTASAEASASPGSSGPGSDADRLTQELLAGPTASASAAAPLATVRGTIPSQRQQVAATADLLSVRATGQGTVLRWRLRSGTSGRARVFGSGMAVPPVYDTRRIALVDAAANTRLQPYTYRPIDRTAEDGDTSCSCSDLPRGGVGEQGVDMYAVFPPLGPETTTVDVLLPGFPAATGLAVTR